MPIARYEGSENQVVSVKPQTGEVAWHQAIDPGDGIENVYVERSIQLLQTGAKLIALQRATGKLLWQRDDEIQSLYFNQAGDLLYMITIEVPDSTVNPNAPIWSELRAIDVVTGKPHWSTLQPITVGGHLSHFCNQNTVQRWHDAHCMGSHWQATLAESLCGGTHHANRDTCSNSPHHRARWHHNNPQ